MIVLLGTLWRSIKQIEAPYMFDWENAITLHTMHGNRASSPGEVEVSWVFSSCVRNCGIFSSDGGDVHSKLEFVQRISDTCLRMKDNIEM